MQFICKKCGKTVPADTRSPRCGCGGLWTLDFKPPRFSMDGIDREELVKKLYTDKKVRGHDIWRGRLCQTGRGRGDP